MLDTQVHWLPVEQIAPNPHQPRREFAPGPLAELAESIRRHGIIQPLTVRHSADGWELIAGERRLRAAKLAGLQTVPCLEMQVDEQDSAILALIENIQRRDLHYLEEAAAIAAYLRQSGSTQEEAAALLGRSPSALANKLRLLRLSPDCCRLLTEHDLTERHARALLRLEDEEERLNALHHIIRQHLNVAQTEQYIDKRLAQLQTTPPLRPPGLSSQGRPPISQQSGPGPAAGAGGRHRRRIPPGGHGGRHPPHYPHPQEPPDRLTFTVLFKKRRLRSPLFGFFGNRSLPLTPKVKIIPLCYRIVTPFFRKE